MLDFKEAKQVHDYLKDNLFSGTDFPEDLISVHTLICIPLVCQLDRPNPNTVLALQLSNETILVRFDRSKDGLKIHKVQKVKW